VKDSVDAVAEVVPQMKADGDQVVVILSHSSIDDDVHTQYEENVSYLITKICKCSHLRSCTPSVTWINNRITSSRF
jgi:2',3'-cyclic-nucleotide 2'-phosphodiesterase (5'-nucleotidase family)